MASGKTWKFQVRFKPSTEFPVISESERIANSGTRKNSTSQAQVGRLSRYGAAALRSFNIDGSAQLRTG